MQDHSATIWPELGQKEGSRDVIQCRGRQHPLQQRAREQSGWGLIHKQLVLMGWLVFPAVITLGKGAARQLKACQI